MIITNIYTALWWHIRNSSSMSSIRLSGDTSWMQTVFYMCLSLCICTPCDTRILGGSDKCSPIGLSYHLMTCECISLSLYVCLQMVMVLVAWHCHTRQSTPAQIRGGVSAAGYHPSFDYLKFCEISALQISMLMNCGLATAVLQNWSIPSPNWNCSYSSCSNSCSYSCSYSCSGSNGDKLLVLTSYIVYLWFLGFVNFALVRCMLSEIVCIQLCVPHSLQNFQVPHVPIRTPRCVPWYSLQHWQALEACGCWVKSGQHAWHMTPDSPYVVKRPCNAVPLETGVHIYGALFINKNCRPSFSGITDIMINTVTHLY